MKKHYEVRLSETGQPIGLIITTPVQAESEHEAMQIALQRYPNNKVISVKQK